MQRFGVDGMRRRPRKELIEDSICTWHFREKERKPDHAVERKRVRYTVNDFQM